jgi:hypothetical protein
MEIVELEPTTMARVRCSTTADRIGADIRAALDQVWALIRAGGATVAGHNIAVYHGGFHDVELGVQVAGPFPPQGDVAPAPSPSGPAVHEAHLGPYDGLRATHDAVRHWAAAEDIELSDVVVEVYGDWVEDVSQLRTDVYHLVRPASAPRHAGAA